ncbi:MAG: BMP family ABC transporter substrate-binding protein [Candidatus Dormibacterales bacterium]
MAGALLFGLVTSGVAACATKGAPAAACGAQLRVGIVTAVPAPADPTFGPGFWQGVVDHVAQDGAACATASYLVPSGPADFGRSIDQLVAEGDRLVVSVGPATATAAAAAAHPKVRFATLDASYASPPSNLRGVVIRQDEAGFLAGALAAMLSRTGTVGAVFGPSDGPLVHRYGEGFRDGAHYANPAATVYVLYASHEPGVVSGFEWGRARAQDEMDQGADVVMGGGGDAGHGALLAAAEAGRLCVGTAVDAFYTDPQARGCLVTSAVENVAEAVVRLAAWARAGRPGGGPLEIGTAGGGVGLAPFHQLRSRVPAGTARRIEQISDALADGSLSTGVAA